MAQIKSLNVGIERKVTVPGKQYENVTFSVNIEVDVKIEDNIHEVYDNAIKFCKSKINKELDRLEGKIPKTEIDEDYIPSKPVFNNNPFITYKTEDKKL